MTWTRTVFVIFICLCLLKDHFVITSEEGDLLTGNRKGRRSRSKKTRKRTKFGKHEEDAMSYILEQNSVGSNEAYDVVIEGDIDVPREDVELQMAKLVLRDSDKLWKNGTVPYVIDSRFKKKNKKYIIKAMKHFEERTCIRFIPRTNQADYVYIESSDRCRSLVGRIGGKQYLRLGESGCMYLGTIIHELMHTLGFYHEQSRTDRDKYIDIQWHNIERGRHDEFQKYGHKTTDTLGAPYDYFSVMHYHETAFSKNGRPTIVPKLIPDVEIVDKNFFSRWDLFKLNKLYKCGRTGMEEKVLPGTGECFVEKNAVDYRGKVSRTKSGRVCQNWSSQSPHRHIYTEEKYNYALHGLGDHNFCRNPNNRKNGAWCFTTDPKKKTQTCYVGKPEENCQVTQEPTPTPRSPIYVGPIDGFGDIDLSECYENANAVDYRGSVSETRNGIPCQKWTDQYPFKHDFIVEHYPNSGLGDHSFCRNPNSDSDGAWCFSSDDDRGYMGYCNIGEPADNCQGIPWCGIKYNFKFPISGIYDESVIKVQNKLKCCESCWNTRGCMSWTFDKRPGQTFGNCWLKDSVEQGMGDNCCDSGVLTRPGQ
ncbi:uncharacterized protein LOC144437740 isoform X2 [Glandiceps talaboti]